jgi:hypothetical protein
MRTLYVKPQIEQLNTQRTLYGKPRWGVKLLSLLISE